MSDGSGPSPAERAFLEAVGGLGSALLGVLSGLEAVERRLHPPEIASLRGALTPAREHLDLARERFDATPAPDGLSTMARQLGDAARHAAEAASLFCDDEGSAGVTRILASMRAHCRAQDALFPLRDVFPSIGRYYLEPALSEPDTDMGHPSPVESTPEGRTDPTSSGLFTAHNAANERGGFTLYVPETHTPDTTWPLVIALHGGHGHGADFLWTWLREARSRGFLLLAPTSRGSTWSLDDPRIDTAAIVSMIDHISERWPVDRERMLLTGLSDGATFSLLAGLSEGSPFRAIAPVSGVLHPLHYALGNLERAAGRRIYLVHGALDWMFPVQMARESSGILEKAGADVTYREIEDLSHAYPREENAHILDWFDPTLAIRARA